MKVLAYGKIDTLVWSPEKRLVRKKTCHGDHTEITTTKWIK